MIKAVLFDFRGTLVNTEEAQRNAVQYLYYFVHGKRGELSFEAVTHFFEQTRLEIKEKFSTNAAIHNWNLLVITSLFSKLGVQVKGAELQQMMEQYDRAFVERCALFLDVEPMLNFLKTQNLKLGVVIDGTAKRERLIISKLNLQKYLDVIVISEEVGRNKLSGVPLQKAVEQMHLPPSEIIVVGDRIDKDILPANALGCVSVLIQRGQGQNLENLQREAKPRHVIGKLTELANFVV